jgi:tetratricopeptide (TPR) repeat protein
MPETCKRKPQMKIRVLMLAVLAVLPVRADTAANLYKQGMTAIEEGDVRAAELAFKEVLRLQPTNANARYQLGQLKQNQDSIAARGRSRQLAQYKIDFNKTEVSEALTALGMLIEKKSEGKFAPNFMIKDPSNKLGDREVTLQVKKVPASAALDMILQQAGASARFEKHAIVVVPRPGTSSSEPSASQAVKKDKANKQTE